MQDFLMVDFMQADIVDLLLDRFKVIAMDDNAQHQMELLLSQLKFADHFVTGDKLCDRIMSVLELVGSEAREIIIRYLPDIIDVGRHCAVVDKLM